VVPPTPSRMVRDVMFCRRTAKGTTAPRGVSAGPTSEREMSPCTFVPGSSGVGVGDVVTVVGLVGLDVPHAERTAASMKIADRVSFIFSPLVGSDRFLQPWSGASLLLLALRQLLLRVLGRRRPPRTERIESSHGAIDRPVHEAPVQVDRWPRTLAHKGRRGQARVSRQSPPSQANRFRGRMIQTDSPLWRPVEPSQVRKHYGVYRYSRSVVRPMWRPVFIAARASRRDRRRTPATAPGGSTLTDDRAGAPAATSNTVNPGRLNQRVCSLI
jgi:hypothetical protein